MIQRIINFILSLFRGKSIEPFIPPTFTPDIAYIPPQTVTSTPKPPSASPSPIVAPNTAPIVDKSKLLDIMCEAIKSREGYIAPCAEYPQGTPSWRNNNIGNLRFANQPGAIGKDPKGFAIFVNYQAGDTALRSQILLVARGKSSVYPNPCTILQFFNIFSPPFDGNDPISYCDEVRGKMRVSRDWLLSNLI